MVHIGRIFQFLSNFNEPTEPMNAEFQSNRERDRNFVNKSS